MKGTIFYLVIGIFYFLLFAWDIENSRDFFTWIWLLTSQIWMGFALIEAIAYKIKNK